MFEIKSSIKNTINLNDLSTYKISHNFVYTLSSQLAGIIVALVKVGLLNLLNEREKHNNTTYITY